MSEEEIICNVKRIIEYKIRTHYINNNDSRAIQGLLDLYYKQQKEIEVWKETENDYEHELARKDEKIEKQQKEIEELKERKKDLVEALKSQIDILEELLGE